MKLPAWIKDDLFCTVIRKMLCGSHQCVQSWVVSHVSPLPLLSNIFFVVGYYEILADTRKITRYNPTVHVHCTMLYMYCISTCRNVFLSELESRGLSAFIYSNDHLKLQLPYALYYSCTYSMFSMVTPTEQKVSTFVSLSN